VTLPSTLGLRLALPSPQPYPHEPRTAVAALRELRRNCIIEHVGNFQQLSLLAIDVNSSKLAHCQVKRLVDNAKMRFDGGDITEQLSSSLLSLMIIRSFVRVQAHGPRG
jgi:hypothetical protein